MKNKLADLNDHLFAQIERLSDESLSDDGLEREVKRANAVSAAADAVIRTALVQTHAARIASDYGIDPTPWLPETKPAGRVLNVIPKT